MGYTHSLTFLRFFAKLKCFSTLWNQNSKKPRVFQNSKIPKKNINLPKYFWNFGILEVYLEFWNIPKKPKVFLEFDPKTSKHPRFFLNFIADSQKTHGFERFSTKISKQPWAFWNFPKFQKTSSFPKFQNSKNIWASWYFFLEFWNFGKLEVFLEFDPKTSKNTRFFWNFIANSKKTQWFLRLSTKIPKKPRVFQNSKNFKTRLISPNIFGILEFCKTRVFFGIVRE